MKTQSKIALISGLVCISLVVLFGTAIYFFLNKYSYVDFYKRLETRARISARYNFETDTLNAQNLINLRNQYLEKLENEQEILIEVGKNFNPEKISKQYKVPSNFISSLIELEKASEKNGNIFYVGIVKYKDSKKYLIIISAENYYVSHHLIFIRNIILGSSILLVFIVLTLSIFFSKYIFNPIQEIITKVKQISTENIHLRLDDTTASNEISDLIHTFNDLLNRIETAFETQKNFISNASHELGTPLTSIIGEADVSLLKIRSIDEYQFALRNILIQAERLDNITKSLLFLAQTGYKGKAISFEIVRMDEVIWRTKSLIDKLNPNNQIVVDLSLLPEDPKKLKVKGSWQLLQLALANVLNNACKYSNNKEVIVYIASSDKNVIVTVKDQGIGIPEAEMPFIYDPFFRASNTNQFEGYGIGLPLSRNVVILHKGILSVTSTLNVGTIVQIKLPVMVFL